MAERADGNPFSARTVLWVIVAGLFAFAGFLLLTAYAPEWKAHGDGGTHAFSKSAVGFSGIYALERDLNGDDALLIRDRDGWYTKGLLIVTLGPETDRAALKELIAIRQSEQMEEATTLYVLPKWAVIPIPQKGGWVMQAGAIPAAMLTPLAKELGKIGVAGEPVGKERLTGKDDGVDMAAPPELRWLNGAVVPIVEDGKGRAVLGRVGSNAFVLADPDLLANHGLKSLSGAKAAIAIIEGMRPYDGRDIAFDTVLAGVGQTRNLLRLMFEPPFLAFTLALLIAAVLTGLHALARFGPAAPEGRAIPFGKRALADNAAMLISRAGREGRLGDRYVAVVRDSAGAALGAQALAPDDLERWLGTLPGGFEDLAHAARDADTAASVRDAALALHNWKKDVIRDH